MDRNDVGPACQRRRAQWRPVVAAPGRPECGDCVRGGGARPSGGPRIRPTLCVRRKGRELALTRWAFAVATAVVLVLLPAPGFATAKPTEPAVPKTPKRIQSDFNHDGYEDLAISIFTEDVSGVVD